MFSTLKQRLLLAVYVFIIISIPVGAYLASQNQTYKSSASEGKKQVVKNTSLPLPPSATESASTSPVKELLSLSEEAASPVPATPRESEPAAPGVSPTIATSFGPTLSLKAVLEGRPKDNQATKLFVGIVEGSLTTNPKFLLSFTLDLPANGEYANLSLAGLNPGTGYTALLKSSAQIAASSAFTMLPAVTNLNEGQPINMLTGDLNEDNVINTADYAIVQKIIGATPSSFNWNENADFNKDKIINLFDIGYIIKNLGQTGASGAWTSPLPKTATPSGSLAGQPNLPSNSQGGYWIWIPK